jgi:hypothetical protein
MPIAGVIASTLAAVAACFAAWFSYWSVENQTVQGKTDLRRSLSLEFSYNLRGDRKKFGMAYLSGDAAAMQENFAPPIMQFFETLAYLVNHDRIDANLARATIWDSFSAYYTATKKYWEEENAMDSEIYQEIKELAERWGVAPWTKSDEEMKYFFKTESCLSES